MQEESIEKALEAILKALEEIKDIDELDRKELMLNEHYFLTHYEQETGIKVKKKVKECRGRTNLGKTK